jgi:hypothetical protein
LAFQDQPSAAASLNDGNFEHCSSDCRHNTKARGVPQAHFA